VKRSTIWLTVQQQAALAKASKASGLGVSELIRRAIDEYISKMTKGAK
jgi:hypothetical protein